MDTNTNSANTTEANLHSAENDSSISIKEILDLAWRLKWIIAISTFVCLLVAFVYLRMQTPQYKQSTWIMLNRNDGTNADLNMLAELSGRTVSKKIENEAFILRSPTMMTKVVDELGLNTRYYSYSAPIANRIKLVRKYCNFKEQEFYTNNPFTLTLRNDSLQPEASYPKSVCISFCHTDSSSYNIESIYVNGNKVIPIKRHYRYGEPIGLQGSIATVSLDFEDMMREGTIYKCMWSEPRATANNFIKNLSVDIQGKATNQSDVVIISLIDSEPARARDILNALVLKVNSEARDYENIAARRTAEFIDQRLADIEKELGNAENNYQQYQSNNAVLDLGSQSQLTLNSDQQNQTQLTEVRLQLQILDMLNDYIGDGVKYNVIPANIGISDVGLNSIIANYNSLVVERNRMVANSSESNPRVLSMNTQLDDMKHTIDMSVANLKNVYSMREKELVRTINTGRSKMATIPQQQYQLQKLGRRVDVIEPLYLTLQQKREESQIKMYSQTDTFRILETAFGSKLPISPKRAQIMLLGLIIGIILPIAFVWLRMMLRSKVETKKDITDAIKATSVLAVLPKGGTAQGHLLIKPDDRDATTEAFRMLRHGLQFFSDVNVIQITSSTPGEGKSYVASNLAISLAQIGQKVLIIGMDIRKPKLAHFFGIPKAGINNSLIGYLIGKCTVPEQLITPCPTCEGLDIIQAGPIPPQPLRAAFKESHRRTADLLPQQIR